MARQSTAELARRISDLVHEYDGRISTAEAIGVLECVKATIIEHALQDAEDEDDD